NGNANSYPGKVIDEVVESGVITASDRKEIWNNNVLRWIGK
ncbi:MAG TPA: amidohydrolase, partial [Saprospirales bacterium]|nr:amidohydrolase [Saprospirales bacterium]